MDMIWEKKEGKTEGGKGDRGEQSISEADTITTGTERSQGGFLLSQKKGRKA